MNSTFANKLTRLFKMIMKIISFYLPYFLFNMFITSNSTNYNLVKIGHIRAYLKKDTTYN